MDGLLLHPRTKAELQALIADPPHALLFVAPTGSGKLTVAKQWAAQLAANATVSVLEPDEKGTITIDATRGLYRATRSKQAAHQVVIVDHADAMGGEAQNAFLKLLEEPRANVTFILTAPSADGLLPTILSRVQTVAILPVSTPVLTAHAQKMQPGIDAQSLAQALFVAAGRPATLVSLLQDPATFDHHKETMRRAKQLLAASAYERLGQVQALAKDRELTVATLEAMTLMLQKQIARSPSSSSIQFADTLQECLRRLRQNGNVRAQLVHLFMVGEVLY